VGEPIITSTGFSSLHVPSEAAERSLARWLRCAYTDETFEEGALSMISITEKAADKVKEIADAEALQGQGLRLRVVGGGCSGFSYDLYFEDQPTDMDETFQANGVNLYVDPLSYQYLDGTEIDYVDGLHGSGFKFNNPNVKGTCGCGSSFSA
jgi:iron-sulfur cluster insertion protein